MFTTIRTSEFSFWKLSLSFYVFHRHRVCLADYMDLICSLCSWCRSFVSSSLAAQPLVFNCGFISVSPCGLSKWVYSCACPEGLGFAPVRTRCEGSTAAWVVGAPKATGTQRSLWLGQQEIWCSRRAWKPTAVFPPGESHRQRILAGYSPQGCKALDMTEVTSPTGPQEVF